MAIGFGLLRLSPDVFWSMTPKEFERAVSVFHQKESRISHEILEKMMLEFPDRKNEDHR